MKNMKEKIEPWKVVFTATDLSFNIVKCPECHNQSLCGTVIDYVFCPYCGNRRIQDAKEN